MITRRAFVAATGSALLAASRPARGQQVEKVPRIGMFRLGAFPPSASEPFRQGLRELGYVEGQNVILEYGVAQSVAQLPEVAAALIRLKVDVIVASGTASVLPARDSTRTIPVVFVAAIDPVATGVVASLARPGGHVTGVSADQAALTGKRWSSPGSSFPSCPGLCSWCATPVRTPPSTSKRPSWPLGPWVRSFRS